MAEARVAYEAFASFYDEFTAENESASWAELLLQTAMAAGLSGTRALDVACGTGQSFMPLVQRGYKVTACDISPAMLEQAARAAAGRVTLVEHDMRALPQIGPFDLVWCLGDALNYLDDAAELEAAFRGMAANLAPAGILAADVNSLATFRGLMASLHVLPAEEQVLVLEGRGDRALPSGGAAEVWIDRLAKRDDGWWERCRTVHHHRHHPRGAIVAALEAAGLSVVGVHGSSADGLEPDFDEVRHIKGVYIARHAHESERR